MILRENILMRENKKGIPRIAGYALIFIQYINAVD
jgi:hypothetical protein